MKNMHAVHKRAVNNIQALQECIAFIIVSLLNLNLMYWLMTLGQSAISAALLLFMVPSLALVLLYYNDCDRNSSLHPVFSACFALYVFEMGVILLAVVATMSADIAYSLTPQ